MATVQLYPPFSFTDITGPLGRASYTYRIEGQLGVARQAALPRPSPLTASPAERLGRRSLVYVRTHRAFNRQLRRICLVRKLPATRNR